MKKVYRILLMLFPLISCQKEVSWNIPVSNLDFIVVDGKITNVRGSRSLRIFYPVHQLNETPEPVSGAQVLISNEDSVWQLNEDSLNHGVYRTGNTFIAVPGKNYSLFIYFNDRVYSAKASMVPGAEFRELEYVKNEGNDLYHLDWVANAFSTENPALWEILMDWSMVPGYEQSDPELCKARLEFFTLPTLDVSEIFAPEMQNISFPAGTRITENRYSVTPDYAAFLRSMLLETNWQGGLFNTAPSNALTNLSAGAKGYFAACAVTTLYMTVKGKK